MSKSKSYRKYAATTMAVAVAASAVAPVVAGAEEVKFSDVNENTDHYASIVKAAEAGYLKGDNGKFNPYGTIKRIHVAKVLQRALDLPVPTGDEARAYLERYTDIDLEKETQEDIDAIAAVTKAGIFGQFDGRDGEFRGWKEINREALASVIVRAYKLNEIEADEVEINLSNVSETHQGAVQTLANLGLTTELDDYRPLGDATRGQFAAFLDRTITVVEDSKVEEPEVEAAVESVSAINASEIQVNFTAAVDEDTAKDADNYELKINDVDVVSADILDIALSTDGKVATILLDQSKGFQNGDKYVIQTNDKIESKTGEKLEKFVSEEKTFSETAAPSLISTKWVDDKLVFTFDRPVAANIGGGFNEDVTLVKVDGVEVGNQDLKPVNAKGATGEDAHILGKAGVYEYEITITDPTAKDEAKALGDHEVVIFDVKDTVTSTNPSNASVLTGSYTITDEVTTPEVVGIEAVNANRIFVETNTKVELDSDSIVKVEKGSHEFPVDSTEFDNEIQDTTRAVSDAYVGTHNDKPGIWVIVTDYDENDEENPLYRSGETSASLTVTVEKYQANGLIGKKSVQNVIVNKNNTKPTVDKTVLKEITTGSDELVVTFTDSLAPATLTEGDDFVVRDKDGIIIEDFVATVSGKDIIFTNKVGTKQDFKDAPYKVEFKADKFKNLETPTNVSNYLVNTVKNDAFTVSVGKDVDSSFKYKEFKFETDKQNGDVTDAGDYQVDTANNTITFKYSEKMGDSARDVANYTLDGVALPKGTTVDFVGDKQTVRIVLPEDTFKTTTKYKLGITTNVKTELGSMIVGSLQTKAPAELVFTAQDNIKPKLASAIYYVGTHDVDKQTKTDQIEVTFSEAIQNNTDLDDAEDDFYVEINGSKFEVTNVDTVASGKDADRKLVLTLKQEVNVSQTATITIVPEDEQEDETMGVLDDAGNKAEEGSNVTLTGGKYKYDPALAGNQTDQANLAAAQAQVDGLSVSYDGTASSVTLPGISADGSTVTWSSSDTAVVSNDGTTVNRPAYGDADKTVTLTASVTKGGQTATKDFTVEVEALTLTGINASDPSSVTEGTHTSLDDVANAIGNLTRTFDNGTDDTIPVTEAMLSGIDVSDLGTAGTYTITITYNSETTTVDLEITN